MGPSAAAPSPPARTWTARGTADSGGGRPGGGRPSASLLSYVLNRHDWSESSLIVELFTRERGRLVVVAKGAKKPTSNFRPVLMPFQPLLAGLGRPPSDDQSEVFTLRSAEWVGGHDLLPSAALLNGFYMNELLLKLLAPQDAHPALYDAYAAALSALALHRSAADEAQTLRAFELMLLRELGWLPDLSVDTQRAQALDPDASYTLKSETGLAASKQGPLGAQWLQLEAALVPGSMQALRQACLAAAGALRAPLQELLHYHLGHSPLRTRQVRQGVHKLIALPA